MLEKQKGRETMTWKIRGFFQALYTEKKTPLHANFPPKKISTKRIQKKLYQKTSKN